MRVHVLQHVAFEGLGSMETWLEDRKAQVSWTRFYENGALPATTEFDLLIILGGPMSIHDEAIYPWLSAEKRFIGETIAADLPILGICLGAQLLAHVCGARVVPGKQKEIGWFPVYAEVSDADHFQFPRQIQAFHWHGETFDLPPGATRLAHGAACENQAFQIGNQIIGLQFHLESTAFSIDALIRHCADEIIPDQPTIQSVEQMLDAPADAYEQIHAQVQRVLDFLSTQVPQKVL